MAFTEACLLACFLERPLHFLVRGDVFKSNWEWFFRWTNQIPIYRFRDGFSNMRRNSESFSKAHEALAEEKAILIFSEGNTKLQKKLSPLQKGTARLAFGAYSELDLPNISIVPVGVNYAAGKEFRSDVAIKIGDPLPLSDYVDLYREDHHEAFRKLTEDLYQSMLPLVIHLDQQTDEELADRLFALYQSRQNELPWPILDNDADRFIQEKAIANRLNQFSPEKKSELVRLMSHEDIERSAPTRWNMILMLIIGFPFFIGGFILNAIPFYVAKRIALKKVTQDEFLTPVRLGLIMVLYIVWILLWSIMLILFFGWYGLIAIWLLPLTAYVVILWKEGYDKIKNRRILRPEFRVQLDEILKK